MEKIEVETAAAGDGTTTAPLRFEEFVADLIEDREGKWWLTQVSALVKLQCYDIERDTSMFQAEGKKARRYAF